LGIADARAIRITILQITTQIMRKKPHHDDEAFCRMRLFIGLLFVCDLPVSVPLVKCL
jgi:hypothetical protein